MIKEVKINTLFYFLRSFHEITKNNLNNRVECFKDGQEGEPYNSHACDPTCFLLTVKLIQMNANAE